VTDHEYRVEPASYQAGYQDGWSARPKALPIETAPKDRSILIWDFDEWVIGWWEKPSYAMVEGWHTKDYEGTRLCHPKHWVPLPEPPEERS